MRKSLVRLGAVLLVAAFSALVVAAAGASTSYKPGTTGWDVSWPQCGSRLPRGGSFAVVGANHGLAFSENPCFSQQFAWAASLPQGASVYVNGANPGTLSTRWPCSGEASIDDPDCAREYGRRAAAYSYDFVSETTDPATLFWWLDVETGNSWDGTPEANAASIDGYISYLREQGVTSIGIYSTPSQWSIIAGDHAFGLPVWVAGARSAKTASSFCTSGFAGGEVLLVQYYSKGFDGNLVCGESAPDKGQRPDKPAKATPKSER